MLFMGLNYGSPFLPLSQKNNKLTVTLSHNSDFFFLAIVSVYLENCELFISRKLTVVNSKVRITCNILIIVRNIVGIVRIVGLYHIILPL